MGADIRHQVDRAVTRSRWEDERGQALTEYLMIVGLLTAIIISITKIIVPGFSFAVVSLVKWMSVHMTSVPG